MMAVAVAVALLMLEHLVAQVAEQVALVHLIAYLDLR
jgi:hypothetical protein